LNDNVDKNFLSDMLQRAGFQADEIQIYHHPENDKHLGIARIILHSSKQLKPCVDKFNNKSVMGKVNVLILLLVGRNKTICLFASFQMISVFHDKYGEECRNLVTSLTSEKKLTLPTPDSSTKLTTDFQNLDVKTKSDKNEESYWQSNYSKHKEKEDEWDTYNSHSADSKYDSDYNYTRSGSSSKHDKYEYGRSHRESFDRDRYRKDKDRREYRKKDSWKDRDRNRERRERDKYEYKRERSSHRYGYTKTYSQNESYSSTDTTYANYDSCNYRYENYSYNASTSVNWALPPLPPKDSLPPKPPSEDWPKPPLPVEDFETKSELFSERNKNATDEVEETVDLDTRIAMLFKTKSFENVMPPSVLLNESEIKIEESSENSNSKVDSSRHSQKNSKSCDDSIIEERQSNVGNDNNIEEGEIKENIMIKDEKTQVVNETGSSNSKKSNKKILKIPKCSKTCEEELDPSDISSSEDELLAKGGFSPQQKNSNENDDRMSLSSLSSSESVKHEKNNANTKFERPEASYMYPMGFSSYPNYYYQHALQSFQYTNWNYDSSSSAYKNVHNKSFKPTNDPHEVAIKKVIGKLIHELKQILKKDFNKRMIENTAFKKYEAWWNEQERNKVTQNKLNENEKKSSSSTSLPLTLRDSFSEIYQQNGSLGVLRNLKFQRIKRELNQSMIQDDSRKSDLDDDDDDDDFDMVHGSDSEKEENPVQISYTKTKTNSISSSDSSDLDESSSEDDEGHEDHAYSSDTASLDSASALSDDELLLPIKKTNVQNKEKDVSLLYSDTESDDETKQNAQKESTSKHKFTIYSDSEDEKSELKSDFSQNDKANSLSKEKSKFESDSDYFNEDVMSKPPRTPGRAVSSDEQLEKYSIEKDALTENISNKTVNSKSNEVRIYSDSEEEREYQERIRRNTEWMEQIEKEAKEESERLKINNNNNGSNKNNLDITPVDQNDASNANKKNVEKTFKTISDSFSDENNIQIESDAKIEAHKDIEEGKRESPEKKKRGRPKGSVGKTKETKKVKNGATMTKGTDHQKVLSTESIVSTEKKYLLKFSPSSSDGGSSQASHVAIEHCYSLPPSASPSASTSPSQEVSQAVKLLDHDHGYYGKVTNTQQPIVQPNQSLEQPKKDGNNVRPVGRPRKDPNAPKAQYTKREKISLSDKVKIKEKESIKKYDANNMQLMIDDFVPVSQYNKRQRTEEFDVLCKFLTQGIDQEDVDYMKKAYTYLIQNDIPGTELLHQVHWVDHCATDRSFVPSPMKKRKRDEVPNLRQHVTGSARTEGYYKIDSRIKAQYKYHHLKGTVSGSHLDMIKVAKMQNASREARSNQRRLLTAFGGATESDLLKFNQLKFRKKQLKFAKSAIHDWGLFAMEPIAADEMVIEYVGQMVRPSVADLRESKYEAIGIGSSYLFRIDLETIIDATKCGNLARFINHSCNVSLNFKFF
jgi:[histone H3]-lysine4 N-trimethyltransferase SETD1